MVLHIKDLQGAEALEIGQLIDRSYGYGVIDGELPTSGADPFDVDVPATTALVDGGRHNVAADQVNLEEYVDPSEPRKVVIYVNEVGELAVLAGEPEEPEPPGNIRFNTFRPAPPDFIEVTDAGTFRKIIGTPLVEVWLGADDERVTDKDIRDRRVPSRLVIELAAIASLDVDELTDPGGTTHNGSLAAAADVPSDTDIVAAINGDPNHGSNASHNYRTDEEIRAAVAGNLDAAELRSDSGAADQFLRSQSDGSVVWADVPALEAPVIDTGTVTHTGDGPTDVTIENVSTDETQSLNPFYFIESGVGSAYRYNADTDFEWTGSQWNLHVTFSWTDDPGPGVDATIAYAVYDAAPQVVSGRFTANDAIEAINGAGISPDAVDIATALELPTLDDLSTHAGPSPGDIIVATGNGPDARGMYLWDEGASDWDGPFLMSNPAWSDISIDAHKDMAGHQLRNLAAPQFANSAARKSEVDAVQSSLNSHAGGESAHHARYTDEEARDAAGAMADDGLSFNDSQNTLSLDIVATDGGNPATLSEGSAVIDTGHSVDGECYMVFPSPPEGVDIACSLEANGTYRIHFEENTTSAGSADVGWKLVRG